MMFPKPVLFAANANQKLAKGIADNLGLPLGDIYHHQFPSGEWYCQLKENVRGTDVFLIQSVIYPANDNLMQLLIMADACRRASAGRITAVIPYLGYSRQDRKDKSRVPISAKLVMDIIAAAGINRVVTMDLHAPQIAGFTNLPFDHLHFRPALIEALKNKTVDVVVAPDIGAVKRAEEYARKMNADLAFISKKRTNDTTVEATQFVGDVNGRSVLIVDDITESAGTLVAAAEICRSHKAFEVYCAVTHNCLSKLGHERLEKARNDKLIDMFLCSNSTDWAETSDGVVSVVDASMLFAKAIQGITNNQSISSLFE
jgi:ribose-phosphate pyrophosphokinase